jgi:hypothetical protein
MWNGGSSRATHGIIAANPDEATKETPVRPPPADTRENELADVPVIGETAMSLDEGKRDLKQKTRSRGRLPSEQSQYGHSAREQVPTPSESGTTGTLTVTTPGGWASVFLNGHYVGETPIQISGRTGNHVLELLPHGMHPSHRITTTIQEGENTRVRFPLEGK